MSTPDELRRIADTLEAHPDVRVDVGLSMPVTGDDRAAIAAILDIGDPQVIVSDHSVRLSISGDVAVAVYLYGQAKALVTTEVPATTMQLQPRPLAEIREALDA